MKFMVATIAVLASVSAAQAEYWTNSQYGCDWNQHSTSQPPDAESIAFLDQEGMKGWEWQCSFGTLHISPVGQITTVADCSAEGDSYVQTVTIDSLDNFGFVVQPLDGPATWFKYHCE